MQIDDKLNLTLPVHFSEDGEPLIWAYHTPISKEIFKQNYRIFGATNAAIWGKGLKYAATAGARVGNLTLLDIAKADAAEYGTNDNGPQILAEIKRLTFILGPNGNGFEMLPVDAAITKKVISEDDWDEAEASIVFFTVAFAMSRQAGRRKFCDLVSSVIAGSITSLSATEFAASLKTSTVEPTSPPAEQVLSIPS